jgi:2-C-methyl-D-erythritol 4-phosphate cytidylyltransferase
MSEPQKADAIIVAAGSGTRFGAPKQLAGLRGMPMYQHSLKVFAEHPLISRLVLVISADHFARIEGELGNEFCGKNIEITLGGAVRQDSVFNGLQKLEESDHSDIVLVHDAARPFITPEVITNVIGAVEKFGAALAAIPIVDTLKQSEDGFTTATIPRKDLWRAQTPQGAKFDLLKRALLEAQTKNYTGSDEAELLEKIGVRSYLSLGDGKNRKITFEQDLQEYS